MIYRIIVDECLEGIPSGKGRLTGLMNSHFLSKMMDELGMTYPTIQNLKARFYFTEAGWRQCGRILAAEARRQGHVVRVIRRKEPASSQVIYSDDIQLAVLPKRDAERQR